MSTDHLPTTWDQLELFDRRPHSLTVELRLAAPTDHPYGWAILVQVFDVANQLVASIEDSWGVAGGAIEARAFLAVRRAVKYVQENTEPF